MTGFYLTGSINVPTVQDAFRLVGSAFSQASPASPTANQATGRTGC